MTLETKLRVRVVLVDANGAEVVLGPFNHGIALESEVVEHGTVRHKLVDVATREPIAWNWGGFWSTEDRWFQQVFVQGIGDLEEM